MASWAHVARNGKTQTTFGSDQRQDFSWKTAKKGRIKEPAMPTSLDKCQRDHCQSASESCKRRECMARLERALSTMRAENIALFAAFETRLGDLDILRQEIVERCKMDDFFSEDMESSRLAVLKAKCTKTTRCVCECTSCMLEFHAQESALFNERLAAAQHRLNVLREYRISNDKEVLHRTSATFAQRSKYFTPVGSSKGKGVSALKPTLQMQSSYDVTALTTNSMVARPLKIAWKNKPKTLRIVNDEK